MADNKKTSQIIVRLTKPTFLKFKYLAWYNKDTMSEAVGVFIDKEIAAFEKKHGPITDELIKEARIN